MGLFSGAVEEKDNRERQSCIVTGRNAAAGQSYAVDMQGSLQCHYRMQISCKMQSPGADLVPYNDFCMV